MKNNMESTFISLIIGGLFTATVLFAPYGPSAAQENKKEEGQRAAPAQRAAPQQHAAPQRAAPRVAAPRATPQRAAPHIAAPRMAPQRSAPRVATPSRSQPHIATPRSTTTRTVAHPAANSRVVGQRKAGPKVAAPAAGQRPVAASAAAARATAPIAGGAVTASRLRGVPARGAGRTVIQGQNYSAWRSGYRVRHGSGWATFVALSTLEAIAIGSSEYYPYAYVSAPENYCQGLTEDGCQLTWQQVQTVEGYLVDQCVAYCPWQQ